MAAESPHAARICVIGRPTDACRSLAQAWGFLACAMQWAGEERCMCDDLKHPWSSGYDVGLTRWRSPARSWLGVVNGSGQSVCCKEICDRTTHLVAMTSAQHAQGCQLDPGWVSGMAAESPHAARICVTGRPPDACRSLAQAWGFVACAMHWAGVELCVCDDFKHPWSSGYDVSLTR